MKLVLCPALPDMLSPATVAPTRGLYVGSTLAPNWLASILDLPEGLPPLWISRNRPR